MIRKITLILTSLYFLAGSILLPQGDFSAISQLREMYHHCKTIEDPDLVLSEFITGHLLNLDCFFDMDEGPDEHELPHTPIPFHTTSPVAFNYIADATLTNHKIDQADVTDQPEYHSPYFSRTNTHKIFQPPRV